MAIRALLVATVLAVFVGVAPASATFPGGNARIAIQTSARSIDTINSSGGDRKTLVGPAASPTVFSVPAWSPDGTKVAFATNRDGNAEVYVVSFASGALTNLTNHAAEDGYPAWSPDGTKIAFETNRDTRNQIYVMNADGSGAVNISSSPTEDTQPSWSPDGTRIAFVRGGDIWVTSANGGQGTPLTSGAPEDSEPDWSPDGSRIVFQRDAGVVVMGANGANQTPLPLPSGSNSPAWSPDGTKLLFELGLEVWVAGADGSGATALTTAGASGFTATNPDWQRIPPPAAGGGGQPPPAVNLDGDGDGVLRPADCNDNDRTIHPGARDKPGDKIDQNCDKRDARFRLLARTIEAFSATYPSSAYTKFTSMTVKPVRKGDRIRLTCKGPGCELRKKTIKVRKNARKLNLLRHLKGSKLRKGAVVRLRITRPGTIGKVGTWKIRAPKIPTTSRSCLPPGAKKPGRCPRS